MSWVTPGMLAMHHLWDIITTTTLLLESFYDPLSGTTRVSRYQMDKPFWILLKQRKWGGSGNSWTICKLLALCSRNNHTSTSSLKIFTGRMLFLTPNQQLQSTEGMRNHYLFKNPETVWHCWWTWSHLVNNNRHVVAYTWLLISNI